MATAKKTEKKVTLKASRGNRQVVKRVVDPDSDPKNPTYTTANVNLVKAGATKEFNYEDIKHYLTPDGEGHYKVKAAHARSFGVV